MVDGLNVPTCVLKVNTQCCEACPMKVKKKLQKINGVQAVDIDTKNGLVSIRGNVQPSVLIQTISEKFGKEAELYAYEKDPKNIIIRNETIDKAKSSTCSACKDDDEEKKRPSSFTDVSDDACEKAVDFNQVQCFIPKETKLGKQNWPHPQQYLEPQQSGGMKKKKLHGFTGWFGNKSSAAPTMFGCKFGAPARGPPLGYARLPPYVPPPPYRYGQCIPPPPEAYPRSPPFRITKPSKPYPYDFYEKKDAPKGNSAFHSFRDDNVNACTIM